MLPPCLMSAFHPFLTLSTWWQQSTRTTRCFPIFQTPAKFWIGSAVRHGPDFWGVAARIYGPPRPIFSQPPEIPTDSDVDVRKRSRPHSPHHPRSIENDLPGPICSSALQATSCHGAHPKRLFSEPEPLCLTSRPQSPLSGMKWGDECGDDYSSAQIFIVKSV